MSGSRAEAADEARLGQYDPFDCEGFIGMAIEIQHANTRAKWISRATIASHLVHRRSRMTQLAFRKDPV
jgi:hypothetical protein